MGEQMGVPKVPTPEEIENMETEGNDRMTDEQGKSSKEREDEEKESEKRFKNFTGKMKAISEMPSESSKGYSEKESVVLREPNVQEYLQLLGLSLEYSPQKVSRNGKTFFDIYVNCGHEQLARNISGGSLIKRTFLIPSDEFESCDAFREYLEKDAHWKRMIERGERGDAHSVQIAESFDDVRSKSVEAVVEKFLLLAETMKQKKIAERTKKGLDNLESRPDRSIFVE